MLVENRAAGRAAARILATRFAASARGDRFGGHKFGEQQTTAFFDVRFVERVQDFLAGPVAGDQPFVLEYFEVMRDRRLRGAVKGRDNVADAHLAFLLEQLQNILSRRVAEGTAEGDAIHLFHVRPF